MDVTGITRQIPISAQPIEQLGAELGSEHFLAARQAGYRVREALSGRTLWHINTTAEGGGVAELLQSLLPYVRGVGVDTRWLVIRGTPAFFAVTKRLHHALHGEPGDGSFLGSAARRIYEEELDRTFQELRRHVQPRDVVVLHDQQTAGLAPAFRSHGVTVLWRSHVGTDRTNDHTRSAWNFLSPYVRQAIHSVFLREAFIPAWLSRHHASVIAPSIDPASPKNQFIAPLDARQRLVDAGLLAAGGALTSTKATSIARGDRGRIDARVRLTTEGGAPHTDTPLVLQIARWDRLKDPVGTLAIFAEFLQRYPNRSVAFMLAGPETCYVADDAEGATQQQLAIGAWQGLPSNIRRRIVLASLPMADRHLNALLVNALQRHATIIVQKSLQEGFGLTVTEAMWKAKPIAASAVGGIQDQIVNKEHGILVSHPQDTDAWCNAIDQLLSQKALAQKLGHQARERARINFLPPRHLLDWAALLERVLNQNHG